MTAPAAHFLPATPDGPMVRLAGDWTLGNLSAAWRELSRKLAEFGADRRIGWDLVGIERLDSTGAVLLWRAWGRERPRQLLVRPEHDAVLRQLARVRWLPPRVRRPDLLEPLAILGRQEAKLLDNVVGFVALLGYLVLDFLYLIAHPGSIPWKEMSATIYKAGALALPVTALVGFLIGIVVSYLSALTLRSYGAGLYIIDILGVSIIRELGPVLVAILLAGRSGSAMTAQLGVMRVTEEIDAMRTIGLSPTLRLVLPKVFGLALAMPLVSLWAVCAALLGGWVAAYSLLGISFSYFFQTLPSVVHPDNVLIAIAKSVTFGAAIAFSACHFGLRVEPNTESVSAGITRSVVISITVVILFDAVYAVLFRNVGFFA